MVSRPRESQQTQTFFNPYENVLPAHYRLIEMVGRGGMAEVFLGEDTRLGRKVAIKFLNAEFRRDPDRVRRFRQEARSASALNHPNILTIHDIGDSNGVQFIVSEFVEGETLGTRIAQARLSLAETIDVALQIASALSASHAAGIVHRDIKPDNVMIRNDGVVKVLDFGLAKARGFATSSGGDLDAMTLDSGSTSPGLIVGTPQYMSPEQARGKELDGRTDIFSLGILIFEMLTRHSPFDTGGFADTMAAILTKEPRRLDEFIDDPPARLIDLVARCLRKEREERFSSMAEIIRELKLLKGEEVPNSVVTGEVSVIDTGRTQAIPTHRHSIRSFLSSGIRERTPVTAIILLTAAVLVGGWWAWNRVSFTSKAPELMRTVPIASWSGSASELVISASFSPGGRMVAYAARKGDSTEIWVKSVVGGDPVQITKNGGYNQYPIWSADGEEILFFSDRGNSWGFWKVPFTGGNLSRVLASVEPTARPILWREDGTIYFQSKRELFRTFEDSQSPEQVTSFAESGVLIGSIEISHDASKLVYSVKEEDSWTLKVSNLSGGGERQIGSSSQQIDYIAWHPNSRSVFSSFSVDGSLQVFESSLDSDGALRRSNGEMNYVVQDVSENGSVLYTTLSETSDLWRINTSDSFESIVANDVALEFWPDVSHDGSIVFQSGTHVERPDLSTIKLAVPGRKEASTVSSNGFYPSWSNRGEWIAFFLRGEAGYEIWRSRPDGIDLSRVSDSNVLPPYYFMAPYNKMAASDIAWSPDDSHIAFTAADGGGQRLFVAAADGSKAAVRVGHNLVETTIERSPVWTLDGRSLISLSTTSPTHPSRDKTYRLHATEIESGERRLLYEGNDPVRILGLTERGNGLIFAKRTDQSNLTPTPNNTEIFAVSLSSGLSQKLITIQFAYFHNIHLSRDGKVLAYVTTNGESTSVFTVPLPAGPAKELLVINDPKILVSSLGISRDGSFVVFGKQTRTNLLSMLTR